MAKSDLKKLFCGPEKKIIPRDPRRSLGIFQVDFGPCPTISALRLGSNQPETWANLHLQKFVSTFFSGLELIHSQTLIHLDSTSPGSTCRGGNGPSPYTLCITDGAQWIQHDPDLRFFPRASVRDIGPLGTSSGGEQTAFGGTFASWPTLLMNHPKPWRTQRLFIWGVPTPQHLTQRLLALLLFERQTPGKCLGGVMAAGRWLVFFSLW